MRLQWPVFAIFWLAVAVPAVAHHSLEAQYDADAPITLKGTVTKVTWSNPHVHFVVAVMGSAEVENWEIQMGSPNAQLLGGWNIDTLKPGDHVVVNVYPARDGSHLGFARRVKKVSH